MLNKGFGSTGLNRLPPVSYLTPANREDPSVEAGKSEDPVAEMFGKGDAPVVEGFYPNREEDSWLDSVLLGNVIDGNGFVEAGVDEAAVAPTVKSAAFGAAGNGLGLVADVLSGGYEGNPPNPPGLGVAVDVLADGGAGNPPGLGVVVDVLAGGYEGNPLELGAGNKLDFGALA